MRKNFPPKAYFSVAKVLLVRKYFLPKAYLSVAEVFQMRKNFLAERGPFSELQNRSLGWDLLLILLELKNLTSCLATC